jgi:hypothetical protein
MYSLHRSLVDYDMALLRALARSRGIALNTNRQTEAVDQLAAGLLEPLSVRTALGQLSPRGQSALEALLAAGGRMRVLQFTRRFGQIQPIGPGRLERKTPWQTPANAAEELWYVGFVFRAFAEDEAGPGEFFFVPDDLLPLLPRPASEPPAFAVATVGAPAHQGDGGQDVILDLFTYLVYLQNYDVRPNADGHLRRQDQAGVGARLIDGGERRLAFIRHLAGRLGFVADQGGKLHLESAAVKRWLVASSAHQLSMLQKVWRDDPTWLDLCHVPGLECDRETSWHLQYDPVATRRALFASLAQCPRDAWWSLSTFIEAVKETDPDFQRPNGDYTSWYIREAASGTYLSGFESWDRVEGALIADLLTGPLCWLGVVASGTVDGDVACRLTEAGARLLDLAPDEAQSPPSEPIVVHADFSVELPQPANLYTRFQLERFADLKNTEPCRYLLTVEALGRAWSRGIRVEQVLAFLQQASEAPLPANVAGQLHLWAGRFGQVELEEVALLRVKSERVLRELSALPEIRHLIRQVLAPTTVVVAKQDLPRLRKALRALGYLPPPQVEPPGDPTKRG